jgi:hypothetical protein
MMNLLKVKTAAFLLVTAAVLTISCEDEPLGPPPPAVGGNGGGGGGVEDIRGNGGEGAILIDGEVPTCLEGK